MGDCSRKRRSGAAWRTLLIALSVAAPVRSGAALAAPKVPATRPQDRVIFDAEATRKMLPPETTGEVWTPTLADVTAFEERLPAYLRDNWKTRRNDPLWKRAPRYKRQYLGFTRHGDRIVYGNFFCAVPSNRAPDWRTVVVRVMDGGDCFFSVEYVVKRGTFRDLVVNGEA